MCGNGSVLHQAGNVLFGAPAEPGNATHAQEGESNAAKGYYDELAREGKVAFGEAQNEYKDQAGLRQQMIDEATLTPDKIDAARTRSMADVENAYEGQKAATERANAAMGVNPGDPAAAAGSNATNVNLAAATVGSGNQAALNERNFRDSMAGAVTGRETPTMATGMAGSAQAGAGFTGLAGQQVGLQQSQEQQQADRSGLLGFLAKGGRIPKPSLGFSPRVSRPHVARMRPGLPRLGFSPNVPALATGGEPPQFGPLRDIPLVKRPDGSFGSPKDSAVGHITGPGSETSDSVDAKLAHNEYVQPAFVTLAMGTPTLDSISEMARRAMVGDPTGKASLAKIIAIAAHFAANEGGVPKRVAGHDPQGGGYARGRGMGFAPQRAAAGGDEDGDLPDLGATDYPDSGSTGFQPKKKSGIVSMVRDLGGTARNLLSASGGIRAADGGALSDLGTDVVNRVKNVNLGQGRSGVRSGVKNAVANAATGAAIDAGVQAATGTSLSDAIGSLIAAL